ncbi:hypothetical protein HPB50_020727 [Hyalomma asiaticum]|uniref:Uncharacterized protein n=1 Tax=Hyalomma asiaticum TaxID=266040 RepID=A0ACB7TKJ0_HYAAI|nr:hypothetical protein HPB50_020727 [Hyalomma asiaticum]
MRVSELGSWNESIGNPHGPTAQTPDYLATASLAYGLQLPGSVRTPLYGPGAAERLLFVPSMRPARTDISSNAAAPGLISAPSVDGHLRRSREKKRCLLTAAEKQNTEEEKGAATPDVYNSAVATVAEHFDTTCNPVADRHRFDCRIQSPGEPLQKVYRPYTELAVRSFKSRGESLRLLLVCPDIVFGNVFCSKGLRFGSTIRAVVLAIQIEHAAAEIFQFGETQYLRILAERQFVVSVVIFTAACSHFQSTR